MLKKKTTTSDSPFTCQHVNKTPHFNEEHILTHSPACKFNVCVSVKDRPVPHVIWDVATGKFNVCVSQRGNNEECILGVLLLLLLLLGWNRKLQS